MDITAAGIEAETVIPANKPKYALAPASIMERTTPNKSALIVISGRGLWLVIRILSFVVGENRIKRMCDEKPMVRKC